MIGQTLWTEFFANKDWPVASALAVVLLLVLWFLAFLLPAVALVVLLAYLAYRYQIWRDPAALTGGIGRVFRWNRRF